MLLTGASRGIGPHAARCLARGGADLALVARDAEALARVSADARDLGVDVVELPADVTEDGSADRIVGGVLDHFGRLDAPVNNAAGRLVRPEETARVLAWLATNAPKAWSGRVVDYRDTEAVTAARRALLDA